MNVPIALAGVWLAAGIGAAIIVYHVLTRPGTIDDLACARVDDDLNRKPALVGSELDTANTDPDGEFTELDLQWLAEHSIGGVQ